MDIAGRRFSGRDRHAAYDVNPGDLPLAFPPGTGFAAISDVAAVPYLSDKGRDLYRAFLDLPFPRTFVISAAGEAVSMSGGFDPLGRGLAACARGGGQCGVYAVDDRVVWKPFAADLRDRAYKVRVKADHSATVDFSPRLNPDCSPKALVKFMIVQQPAHGRVAIAPKDDFPGFPSDSPLAACDRRLVRGVAVTYTPAKGFSGEDVFSFCEDGLLGPTLTRTVSLTVK